MGKVLILKHQTPKNESQREHLHVMRVNWDNNLDLNKDLVKHPVKPDKVRKT